MSTQPTPSTPYIPQFGYRPQRYSVHNASPDSVSVRWAGLCFTVPPVNSFSQSPALFDDGAPIPGTFSLSDGYTFDVNGNIPQGGAPNWFASEAVRNMLGIDSNGEATSAYARRGLSILPDKPSRDQVEEIRKAGEARYHVFLVEWAQYTVMAWQDQSERSRRAGVPALPPGQDFYKASLILEKHNEIMREKMGLNTKKSIVEEVDFDTIEFETFAIAEALSIAKGIAKDKDIDSAELAEKMIENPKIRAQLQKKYRIRKIGHLDVPTVGEDA